MNNQAPNGSTEAIRNRARVTHLLYINLLKNLQVAERNLAKSIKNARRNVTVRVNPNNLKEARKSFNLQKRER